MELLIAILFGVFLIWKAYDETGSVGGAIGLIILGVIVIIILAYWIEATGGNVTSFGNEP